jgi:hypothetical protein
MKKIIELKVYRRHTELWVNGVIKDIIKDTRRNKWSAELAADINALHNL